MNRILEAATPPKQRPNRTQIRPTRLVVLILASLAPVLAEDRNDWVLDPASVSAGAAFTLDLKSHRYDCGTTYSHQAVDHDAADERITLSFLPTSHPEAICPAVYMPYGPAFAIPALASGSYAVYARVLAPCMTGPGPVCMMEAVPQFAGTLVVGRGAAWILRPKEAPPEKDFALRLLSQAYGNCNTSFSEESLEPRNGALYASFRIERHPDRVCVADIRPHGPTFDAKGLPVGNYPVYALPREEVTARPPTPVLVDTLKVFKGADPTSIQGEPNGARTLAPKVEGLPGTIQGYRPDGRAPLPE